MELKDWLALVGIILTFAVSAVNFVYTLRANRRTSFVNTVTASRLKWIDSLRDTVSQFIAVTARLVDPTQRTDEKGKIALLLQRDTLLHQTVLHLNPNDSEDQSIRELIDHVRNATDSGGPPHDIFEQLTRLRDVTGHYLKKEWNRVKRESTDGTS